MSRILLLIFCIICNYSTAQWRSTRPMNTNLFDITFTDKYTGYAVAQGGALAGCQSTYGLFKTIDGGENWIRIQTGTTGQLKAIHFANQMVGWAAGNSSRIIKTTDGGMTWTEVTYGVGSGYNDIWFKDVNNGFVLGDNGMLRKSTNGGITWTTITSGVTVNLNRIFFYNNLIGFIAGSSGTLLRTTNGGTSWTEISTASSFADIWFTTPADGFALGASGGNSSLYKTQDGGTTWTPNDIGNYTSFKRIQFTSPNIGYISSNGDGILKTTDGGNNWSLNTTLNGWSDYWYGMYFTDDNNGYVCGSLGRISKTSDGGLTWQSKVTAMDRKLLTVAVPHKDTAYFGDEYGKIFKTENGGVSYRQQTKERTAGIHKIYFTDIHTGFACSDSGVILKTIDGGINWIEKPTSTTYPVTDFSFISDQVGFASAHGGLVLKTTDAGESWNSLPTGYFEHYLDIWFNNVDTGYVTTEDIITRTYDGGVTWTQYDPGLSGDIEDIEFTNDSLGYCMNSTIMLISLDAGLTWNTTGGSLGAVSEMEMIDDSTGFFTYSGSQRMTIDSCQTIQSLSTSCGGNNWGMYGIDMTDNGEFGYSVGYIGGSIGCQVNQVGTAELYNAHISTDSYCAGDDLFVAFMGQALTSTAVIYTAQLSDVNGSFASPTTIGIRTNSSEALYFSGVITCQIPGGTPSGGNYRIRVIADNPNVISPDNGFDITIQGSGSPTLTLDPSTPTEICLGDTLELNTTSTAGGINPTYSWTINGIPINYNASSFSSDTLSDGDYIEVTMNSSLSCLSGNSTVLGYTLNYLPPIVINLDADTSVCLNDSIQLNVGTGNSYLWTPAIGLNNDTIPDPYVTVTQPMTYYLQVTSAIGCTATESIEILVNSLPELLTNDVTVCLNTDLNLNATPGGTYFWSPSTGLNNDNTANPVATIVGDITYYLDATSSEGCNSSDSIVIQTHPELILTLESDTTICENDCITIIPTANNAMLSVSWSTATGLNDSTILNPAACGETDITYDLTYTDINSCQAIESINIWVNAIPMIPTISFDGTTLTSTSGFSYQWFMSGNSIINETSISYDPTQNGTYSVEITSAEGCSTMSLEFIVDALELDENLDAINISLYPNPFTESFWIHSSETILNVQLMDVNGAIIYSIQSPQVKDLEMHSTKLSNGIYFCHVSTNRGTSVLKLIKIIN